MTTASLQRVVAEALGLATAVLSHDEGAFAAVLADPDLTLPCLLDQAGALLRLAVGYELALAGLPWQAPAVAALWDQHGAELGFEVAARLGCSDDDLTRPWQWLGDVFHGRGGYVPACDHAVHLASALIVLSLLWVRPMAEWREFCAALAGLG